MLPLMIMSAESGGFEDYANMFRQISPGYHQLNFKWRNQKQVRKNRRRAHAAGKKNAFQ